MTTCGASVLALGFVRARRGDPDYWPLLDEASELASSVGDLGWLVPGGRHLARVPVRYPRLRRRRQRQHRDRRLSVRHSYNAARGAPAQQ